MTRSIQAHVSILGGLAAFFPFLARITIIQHGWTNDSGMRIDPYGVERLHVRSISGFLRPLLKGLTSRSLPVLHPHPPIFVYNSLSSALLHRHLKEEFFYFPNWGLLLENIHLLRPGSSLCNLVCRLSSPAPPPCWCIGTSLLCYQASFIGTQLVIPALPEKLPQFPCINLIPQNQVFNKYNSTTKCLAVG